MSESFATSRPLGGAEEFERRRRSLAAGSESQADPLAELARLVGQDDPFRGVAPQIRSTITPTERSVSAVQPGVRPRTEPAGLDASFRGAFDAGDEAGAPDDPAVVHPALDRPAGAARSGAAPSFETRTRPPEQSADAWARGADGVVPAIEPQVLAAARGGPVDGGTSSKRTLIVLAAVIALTGGGLAASFLAKPSHAVMAVSSASTPTILAATGPSKVQPETPAADPDSPSEPSTLLDKNKNDGTATAKVVNSVEQPVDLGQAMKPATGAQAPDEGAAPSPFPEPRKVKTVLVRPDGTIITDRPVAAADPAAVGKPADQQSSLAFDPTTSLPIVGSPPAAAAAAEPPAPEPAAATPAPAPGKSQARVAVTPKSTGTAASPATPGHAAVTPPKAKPAVAARAPAKPPVAEADATPATETPTASVPSGMFPPQLGAAGSEAEARDLSGRLSRKFADVAGRLSVHKAQSGDKTVYRLRVSGLSQADAKALCAKVSSGGGNCFVARD